MHHTPMNMKEVYCIQKLIIKIVDFRGEVSNVLHKIQEVHWTSELSTASVICNGESRILDCQASLQHTAKDFWVEFSKHFSEKGTLCQIRGHAPPLWTSVISPSGGMKLSLHVICCDYEITSPESKHEFMVVSHPH